MSASKLQFASPAKIKLQGKVLGFARNTGFQNHSDDYQLIDKLGSGFCGQVWSAIHLKAKFACAIKVIDKQHLETIHKGS